ncbi:hypothetical protein D3C86_1032100 [compost metagenome]
MQGIFLPHYPIGECGREGLHSGDLIGQHAAGGDARPVGDDLGHNCLVDFGKHKRRLTLKCRHTRFELAERLHGGWRLGVAIRLGVHACTAFHAFARGQQCLRRLALGLPPCGDGRFLTLQSVDAGPHVFQIPVDFEPDARFTFQQIQLGARRQQLLLHVLQLPWSRLLGQADPGAGRVEQADGLVGQLAGRNVTM